MAGKRKNWTVAICLDVRQKASRDIIDSVMRQIQVLGIDGDEYVCENEIPSLSSPGEISERIGFGNGRSLMNAFKRRYGCAMRDWRKYARHAP